MPWWVYERERKRETQNPRGNETKQKKIKKDANTRNKQTRAWNPSRVATSFSPLSKGNTHPLATRDTPHEKEALHPGTGGRERPEPPYTPQQRPRPCLCFVAPAALARAKDRMAENAWTRTAGNTQAGITLLSNAAAAAAATAAPPLADDPGAYFSSGFSARPAASVVVVVVWCMGVWGMEGSVSQPVS